MVEYGVVRGRVHSWHRAEDVQQRVRANGETGYKSNHFHILVEAAGNLWRCPVNVKSGDGSEVWFKVRDTFTGHPILSVLPSLPIGLRELPERRAGSTLDYVREPLFDRRTMRQLPLGSPGVSDDVQDHLQLHVEQARVQANAEVYVFGSFWKNRKFPPDRVLNTDDGVHDVHMNQGNSQQYRGDDGVFQDGGVILSFPASNRYVGIFLCFQSQVWVTDNQSGHRVPGYAEGPLAGGEVVEDPDVIMPPPSKHRVFVVAAYLNPEGHDVGQETVTLFNASLRAVNLDNWKILDRQNKAELIQGLTLPPNEGKTIRLSGQGAQLGNSGGGIRVLDPAGQLVHAVTYTAADAQSGVIHVF